MSKDRFNSSLLFGFILITIGGFALLNQLDIIKVSWRNMWPLFILVPGVFFELGYFVNPCKEKAGLLVPGGILITIGVLFMYNANMGFTLMSTWWPVFILAPAIGLLQLYIFGERENGILVTVAILGGIGIVFLVRNITNINLINYIFPGILIVIGIMVIIKGT